ncbi:ATP-dependent DNA ligase [Arthrobacter sp. VKM Ac-2550]|uniref:ATP-dependent DNA ligase n=1 Tax=Crystallibacter permensis TaxID=1938888 RepID=UPI002227EFBD|nr:ATP-dependent DNA ligase [Arthrobacter sp. VKM Ac-2550]MCW2131122.1 ATP-dependent DNA ligase LigD ligase module /ATP-dependent DNA ligase LigD phosphoesterase module /ATP-dependent DNA ligase LigD polymerase module [Arthrobacter sp. VKM Ac-2550]
MAQTSSGQRQLVTVDGHRLKLTSLDKVIYPETGTTKAEVLDYYSRIAEYLIPHAAHRPVTRKRWVNGVGTADKPGEVFFQKNLEEHAPAWVKSHAIEHKSGTNVYPMVNDLATLTWLAQISALEIHVPQWKFGPRGKINNPDRLVLDLDPGEGAGLAECAEVARLVRAVLAGMGLDPRPVTSGSKGIHLYAALDGKQTSEEVSAVAHELARVLEADHKDLVVSDMKKTLRRGKVLLDWSQNHWNKTTITPYSLRGRAHPMVAAPRTWEELDDPDLAHLDYLQVLERVAELGDLLEGMGSGTADEESLAEAVEEAGGDPSNNDGGARRSGAAHGFDRLTKYRSMRDPAKTAEPVPEAPPVDRGGNTFVIQEHHARRLHYDFRLEREGVLVSWAVPKGPPTSAGKNHLAVQTEDHPLEYGSFEGTIAKGEYGAGEVYIWDSGTYDLEKWRDGKEVIVILHGKEGGGLSKDGGPEAPRRYALIHTGGEKGENNWLMHLMKDQKPGTYRKGTPHGRQGDDLAKEVEPTFIKPMLATQGSAADITAEHQWAFEMKWDGIRAIAVIEDRAVRLISRNGNDLTAGYPELADLPDRVHAETAVLDGEIVALNKAGRPDFGLLQTRMKLTKKRDIDQAAARTPVHLMLFDLLQLDGKSLLPLEYCQRREILAQAVDAGGDGHIQVPPDLDTSLQDAVDTSKELGLEGVMAKRVDSTYADGQRSRSWIKIKNQLTQEVVIVGWRPGKGSRERKIGSLLVAIPDGADLRYLGRVGSGLTERDLAAVGARLKKMARKTPPLDDVPAADASDAHWVRPALVGEVQFSERTEAGKLRHPVWRGFRPDKKPSDVVVEV